MPGDPDALRRCVGRAWRFAADLRSVAWQRLPHTAPPPGALVLAYHDVCAPGGGSDEWSVPADQFVAQLLTLRGHGYRFVAASELAERLCRGEPVDELAAVTFDDGLFGVLAHATPVLLEHQIPATVFVVGSEQGASPSWDPAQGRTMTCAELREIHDLGVDLASHTFRHRSLPRLTPEERLAVLRDGKSFVEDLTGEACPLLAYPYGHFDPAVIEAARSTGHAAAFTFLNGRVEVGVDPMRIPRLTILRNTRPLAFARRHARPAGRWPDHQLAAVAPPSPQVPL